MNITMSLFSLIQGRELPTLKKRLSCSASPIGSQVWSYHG